MDTNAKSSNWGRWGTEDQRGTLNVISPHMIVEAARLVKRGVVYRLAIPIDPALSSPIRDGTLHVATIRKDDSPSHREVGLDVIALDTHNFTHLDSLAHVGYDHAFYNAVSTDAVTPNGVTRNSIENVVAIAGRAVILDVARALDTKALPPGYAIMPADLERAEKHAGIEARAGDTVLLRTGWIKEYLQTREVSHRGWPGLDPETINWFHSRDICAIGADNAAVEAKPARQPERHLEFHERFIRDLGGYLIEFLDLEQVSAEGIHEGFFVIAPLRIRGGLGSPVTPLLMV